MMTNNTHAQSQEPHPNKKTKPMGISGHITQFFIANQLTPLLALVAFLLGVFAVLVTPREEEPQIDVTMANVMVAFPGATVAEVNAKVAVPAEQVLDKMPDVEHVYSTSHAGMAIMTVQFKVGVPRQTALVNLYDTVHSNQDWLPTNLGVMPPVVKPKGIDDVPMMAITLYSKNPHYTVSDLAKVAHTLETEIKRIKGTRDVETIGDNGRAVKVLIDPARLAQAQVSLSDISQVIQGANLGMMSGNINRANHAYEIHTGQFLKNADEVKNLVVGVHQGNPVYLGDVATVSLGTLPAKHYVWYSEGLAKSQTQTANPSTHQPSLTTANDMAVSTSEYPALTVAITKKAGENAIDIANQIKTRLATLQNTIVPADVSVKVTRNYGETANAKAQKLIQKLLFATLSVIVLVFIALGKREAFIVGTAVILTLTVTLFASWAYGFTLNRVSLFALIFSIGILVDDAIVVVENIHRHQALYPDKTLLQLIPPAVDEVGSPTILATLTVIAALLPMAFVSGLMGPYMSPIPINASMGMLLSLAIAFVVTPWLARLWLKDHSNQHGNQQKQAAHYTPKPSCVQSVLNYTFTSIFNPLLYREKGSRNRRLLFAGIFGLIILAVLLPVFGLVHLKMLPFDNKSEFQVIVDMPAGTPLEQTSAVLGEMSSYLQTVPEVDNIQRYAGTTSPINFNGLVRQYYLRQAAQLGDLQVNLVDKHHRSEQSHAIATRLRPALVNIGQKYNAKVKVVEVPPGPPVLSPIVAEVYGGDRAGRQNLVNKIKAIFTKTESIVDIDDSTQLTQGRYNVEIDTNKVIRLGIAPATIVDSLHTALDGKNVGYLHDHSKYADAIYVSLPETEKSSLKRALQVPVKSAMGDMIALSELVTLSKGKRDTPIFHKDLLPMDFVVADMAGKLDSPLYGMFAMRSEINALIATNGQPIQEYFISQPADPYRHYALKWDGEWQITYETFRDMGLAYAVGLILIYLLVVAQFGSYLTPLIIMAPIPLTILGVMPGHALFGAQFTATSMIGMIALAGIIVRNSILLVDFINLQVGEGVAFKTAIVNSAKTRAQPIILTALAAMLGAFFILDDPIFNGLAISLIFGILVSTVLTLVVIPLLYFKAYRNKLGKINQESE